MKSNDKKNKHMTLDERIEIQECLSKGMTFKAIGNRTGKVNYQCKFNSGDCGGI